jgi:hypothetical protein
MFQAPFGFNVSLFWPGMYFFYLLYWRANRKETFFDYSRVSIQTLLSFGSLEVIIQTYVLSMARCYY